jgi:hypothetical protein
VLKGAEPVPLRARSRLGLVESIDAIEIGSKTLGAQR